MAWREEIISSWRKKDRAGLGICHSIETPVELRGDCNELGDGRSRHAFKTTLMKGGNDKCAPLALPRGFSLGEIDIS
jgi:hypothetical protein